MTLYDDNTEGNPWEPFPYISWEEYQRQQEEVAERERQKSPAEHLCDKYRRIVMRFGSDYFQRNGENTIPYILSEMDAPPGKYAVPYGKFKGDLRRTATRLGLNPNQEIKNDKDDIVLLALLVSRWWFLLPDIVYHPTKEEKQEGDFEIIYARLQELIQERS